mmetsp:Transcript_50190/g.119376  ORF Transcript_50190/g.119376 Transcript_50190/m.119376 type:complete len:84 (-) Transcript_50190:72-323(-)
MPPEVLARARLKKTFFHADGRLRHISTLRHWPLQRVLVEKYKMPEGDAKDVAAFLSPMLELDPLRRPSASAMRNHPFLSNVAV